MRACYSLPGRSLGRLPHLYIPRARACVRGSLLPFWRLERSIRLLTNTVFYAPTKVCPTANFLVKYTKKDTGNALDGDSAIELSPANYGKGEWWLLLDPVLE